MQKHQTESAKLEIKYLSDETFKKQSNERLKKYQITLQQALYSDLSSIDEDLFVCYNGTDHPIYFYFGMLQPNKENVKKLTLYFIKYFNRIPEKDYSFVFLNTLASSDAYPVFKEVFLQLTLDHFLHMKQFIFFKPTYYQRATDYMTFGAFPSYLKTMTVNFFNCSQLCVHLKMSQQDFVDIVPKKIADAEFPNLKARKLNLEEQRINFQGQTMDENQRNVRKEFEQVMKCMLIVKPGQQKFNLEDYEISKIGIPIILQMLVFYFKQHPQGLKTEGIFRKSVSIDEENETLGELINKNYDCLLHIENPHISANLIKRFFSNLKVPVFPFAQFESLMHDQGVRDKKQQIKTIVDSLPKLNYLSLMFLLNFLKQDVVKNLEYNKMTTQNLSICFAPCFLRAQKASMADIIYASKCAMVTKTLLDEFEYIFGDSNFVQQTFRMSQEIQQKGDQNVVELNPFEEDTKMSKQHEELQILRRGQSKIEQQEQQDNPGQQNAKREEDQIEDKPQDQILQEKICQENVQKQKSETIVNGQQDKPAGNQKSESGDMKREQIAQQRVQQAIKQQQTQPIQEQQVPSDMGISSPQQLSTQNHQQQQQQESQQIRQKGQGQQAPTIEQQQSQNIRQQNESIFKQPPQNVQNNQKIIEQKTDQNEQKTHLEKQKIQEQSSQSSFQLLESGSNKAVCQKQNENKNEQNEQEKQQKQQSAFDRELMQEDDEKYSPDV